MSGCTVQRLEAPGLTFLKVSGTVDETFSASQLSGQIRADTILHLGKVTRFSSFGVREWVRLMKDLQGRVKHCILVECSPAVVNQLNVVVDFAAGAHVKSVQLPYACQRCELDKMVTVDVDAQRAELLAGTLPQVTCPNCKNPMVFDDLPGSYLAFLRDAAAPEAGSPMSRFIASFEQAAPKLGDLEAAAAPSASPPAAPPAAPALDPTVPPPGMAGPGGGMKWVAVAAAAAVVVGGGFYFFGRSQVAPQPPPPVNPPIAQKPVEPPPGPPPKRVMSGEESLTLQTLTSANRFSDAEEMIKKLEPVWLEATTASARSSLQVARSEAAKVKIKEAKALAATGKYQEASDALETAIIYGGENDEAIFEKIRYNRKQGNCPAVLASVDRLTTQFATSLFLKQANDYKRQCMSQPAIGPGELKNVMKARQSDIDSCLKTASSPDRPASNVDVAWTVGTTGVVTAASCVTSAMQNTPLCDCLTQQVKRLKFPERPGVTARRATFTFTPSSG